MPVLVFSIYGKYFCTFVARMRRALWVCRGLPFLSQNHRGLPFLELPIPAIASICSLVLVAASVSFLRRFFSAGISSAGACTRQNKKAAQSISSAPPLTYPTLGTQPPTPVRLLILSTLTTVQKQWRRLYSALPILSV